MNCSSCDQPLRNKHQKESHDGLCCDCADEHLGMPVSCRSRPRLKALITPYINCETVDGVHDATSCKACLKAPIREKARKEAFKKLRERKRKPKT